MAVQTRPGQSYSPSDNDSDNADDDQQGQDAWKYLKKSDDEASREGKIYDPEKLNQFEQAINSGQEAKEPEYKQSSSPEQLASEEAAASGNGRSFYKPDTGGSAGQFSSMSAGEKLQAAKGVVWGSNKRKAGTIGGVIGLVGTIGIFGTLSFASGPFEFIHIAQILIQHLTNLEDAGDNRTGKSILDAIKGGQKGDTRLAFLDNTYKNKIVSDLNDAGIKPVIEDSEVTGFTVDTTNPKSPFYGQSADEAMASLKSQLSDKITIKNQGSGKFLIEGDDSDLATGVVDLMNVNGLSTFIRSRVLSEWTLADFHVFHDEELAPDQKASDVYEEWDEDLDKEQTAGEQSFNLNDTNGKEEDNGQDRDVSDGTDGAASENQILSVLNDVQDSPASTILGKASGIIGIVSLIICSARELADNWTYLRYINIVVPLIRQGMDAITEGQQVQYGDDLNLDTSPNELSEVAQQFQSTNSSGQQTSDWSDAAPIQAEDGEGGSGIDIGQGIKSALAQPGPPAWLAWAQSGAVNTFCSAAVQWSANVLGLVLGVASGEYLTVALGALQGFILGYDGSQLSAFLAQTIAGKVVGLATGAQYGNQIDYGAALGANAQAASEGGTQLTNQQVAELNAQNETQSDQQFQSESLADRILNPYDYRSVVGSMIDQLNLEGPQSVASLFGRITLLPQALIKMPATLMTATGLAASPGYTYPFATYGFSEQDLDNPTTADPGQNATVVGQLLDNNGQNGEPDYITKALDCFGVSIAKGPQGWDVTVSTQGVSSQPDRSEGVDLYSDTYDNAGCIDSSDQNWQRIRMWILDTSSFEGYTCYLGDGTSCSDDGFTGNSLQSGWGGTAPSPAPQTQTSFTVNNILKTIGDALPF